VDDVQLQSVATYVRVYTRQLTFENQVLLTVSLREVEALEEEKDEDVAAVVTASFSSFGPLFWAFVGALRGPCVAFSP